MQREEIPVRIEALSNWLRDERSEDRVGAILDSLAKYTADEVRGLFVKIVEQPEYAAGNRQRALSMFVGGLNETNELLLLEIAPRVEDGPVLVDLLAELSKRPKIDSRQLLLKKLDSAVASVRAIAMDSLAALRVGEAAARVPALLKDPDANVRRAAASAAGSLAVNESAGVLLDLALESDPATRSASLISLRQLQEPTAVAAASAALAHPASQLAALDYLAEFGEPQQIDAVAAVAASSRSADVLNSSVRALANWETREANNFRWHHAARLAIAKIQGDSGVLLRWHSLGPLSPQLAAEILDKPLKLPPDLSPRDFRPLIASGGDSRVDINSEKGVQPGSQWLAYSDVLVAEPTRIQCLASSSGTLQVWLNGRSVYQREKPGEFQPDGDRFEAQLERGMNRLYIHVASLNAASPFHMRFRRLSSSAEHERLAQYALQNNGNVDRGREIFLNAEKSLCLKCHRLESQGGSIGPELSGIGSRFSRIHLIESILEPSRTIAPSYDTISVALSNGRVITGVKVMEDQRTLILGDDQGKTHEILETEIDERQTQPRSTMPDGLEKRLTDREFLDLLAFLLAQQKLQPR
jgi:putative heme-binding domain-containing protein